MSNLNWSLWNISTWFGFWAISLDSALEWRSHGKIIKNFINLLWLLDATVSPFANEGCEMQLFGISHVDLNPLVICLFSFQMRYFDSVIISSINSKALIWMWAMWRMECDFYGTIEKRTSNLFDWKFVWWIHKSQN